MQKLFTSPSDFVTEKYSQVGVEDELVGRWKAASSVVDLIRIECLLPVVADGSAASVSDGAVDVVFAIVAVGIAVETVVAGVVLVDYEGFDTDVSKMAQGKNCC